MAPSPHQNRRADAHGAMMPPNMHPQAGVPQGISPQEAAKRRANKPTDKTMPDGVEDSVIGDGVQRYKDLRDFEKRLDAAMTRKRLDIVDSVDRHPKRYKTMRIWITNTVEDQPWQASALTSDAFDFTTGTEASYRVKIEGRLLDDEDEADDEDEEGDDTDKADPDRMDTDNAVPAKVKATPKPPRFSHFFRQITVEFDRSKSQAGPEVTAEWKKTDKDPKNPSNVNPKDDFDEFTFKRNGDDNTNITISLFRDEFPKRYELSPTLADIIDMKEASQGEAVMALWEYIKVMGLQEDEEKRHFRCDALLHKIVNKDTGDIRFIQSYVEQHLLPLPPLKLAYTIRTDEDFAKEPQPTIYDVRVPVPSPLREQLRSFAASHEYSKMLSDVGKLDDDLAVLVQAVGQSKAKHSFFTGLSRDPTNFVRTWLSSQKRDLDVIMGEATRAAGEDAQGDEWRIGGRGSVWATQNARESVNVLLAKQPPGPR